MLVTILAVLTDRCAYFCYCPCHRPCPRHTSWLKEYYFCTCVFRAAVCLQFMFLVTVTPHVGVKQVNIRLVSVLAECHRTSPCSTFPHHTTPVPPVISLGQLVTVHPSRRHLAHHDIVSPIMHGISGEYAMCLAFHLYNKYLTCRTPRCQHRACTLHKGFALGYLVSMYVVSFCSVCALLILSSLVPLPPSPQSRSPILNTRAMSRA